MNYPNNLLNVFIGMASVLFINALLIIWLIVILLFSGVASLYGAIALTLALAISITFVLTQLLCIRTLRRQLIRRGKTDTAKGLAMGSVITALIISGCFLASLANS